MARPLYSLEFYEAPDGTLPVLEWLKSLPPSQRRAVGQAMDKVLQRDGMGVCGTEFGKQLGQGLFEFRVRASSADVLSPRDGDARPWEMLVRIFCHAHGNKLILLLGGYDKAKDPSRKHQQTEIETARRRLSDWRRRHRPPPS
jgi:phage-related protein